MYFEYITAQAIFFFHPIRDDGGGAAYCCGLPVVQAGQCIHAPCHAKLINLNEWESFGGGGYGESFYNKTDDSVILKLNTRPQKSCAPGLRPTI